MRTKADLQTGLIGQFEDRTLFTVCGDFLVSEHGEALALLWYDDYLKPEIVGLPKIHCICFDTAVNSYEAYKPEKFTDYWIVDESNYKPVYIAVEQQVLLPDSYDDEHVALFLSKELPADSAFVYAYNRDELFTDAATRVSRCGGAEDA